MLSRFKSFLHGHLFALLVNTVMNMSIYYGFLTTGFIYNWWVWIHHSSLLLVQHIYQLIDTLDSPASTISQQFQATVHTQGRLSSAGCSAV
jgi:hypothetical protein